MRTVLTPDQKAHAQLIAKKLGRAFELARRAAGESQLAVANRLQMHSSTVSGFERGVWHNLKLGNAVRILSAYDISIVPVWPNTVVVPIEQLRGIR